MSDHLIPMPLEAEQIIQKLQNAGHKAYLVGGAVRNSLLNIPVKDWDICTSALPEEVEQLFKKHSIIETGLQHGTVTIVNKGMPIEVTTFRIDGEYSDGRHPDSVEFTDDLTKDLSRRDFTINSMAYNYEDGLIDPFGGYDDLCEKRIKCVGNPANRFSEDPLRILRAIRFASKLNFKIDLETKIALKQLYRELNKISAERIQSEFLQILDSKTSFDYLNEYREVFGFIIPELSKTFDFEQNAKYHCYDVYTHTLKALEECKSADIITKLSILFHDIGKPVSYGKDESGIIHFPQHAEAGAVDHPGK